MNSSSPAAARPTSQRALMTLILAASVSLLWSCGAPGGSAPADTPGAGSSDGPADGTIQGGVSGAVMLENLMTQAGVARRKILGLAEAIPEDAYAWRPMEGVRSTSEVFVHVAADNYFLPVLMGVDAPEDTGITSEYATVVEFEGRDMTKGEVLEVLAASFDHLEASAGTTGGDLARELALGSSTFTVGGLWTQAVTHLHEHLGQTVAYARANGVVPPWSN